MSELQLKANIVQAASKTSMEIKFNITKFPSGETNVTIIDTFKLNRYLRFYNFIFFDFIYNIHPKSNCAENIVLLAQLKEALETYINNFSHKKINYSCNLLIPYLPYSRYDRHMVEGDSCGLKVFSNIINNLNFDKVITCDSHSSASELCINNFINFKQEEIISVAIDKGMIDINDFDILVAPDQGALKKIYAVNKRFNLPIVCMEKERDPKTGEIVRTTKGSGPVVNGERCLIIDDICDGGRTFIEIAKVLNEQGAKRIELYVTHGILSKGPKPLRDAGISTIYCTDSFNMTNRKGFFNSEKLQFITIEGL